MLKTLLLTGATAAGLYGIGWAFPFTLRPFAEKDAFLTYVNAGDGKMIKRGGEFHDFIISLPGYRLNRPGTRYYDSKFPAWEIVKNGPQQKDSSYDHRLKWMRDFGYFWVGIPGQRSINEEIFAWREEAPSEPEGIARKELTRIFKVNSFPYLMVDTEILTSDKLGVKVIYVVALRINNPYKALIATEDWLVQIEAALSQAVRNFVGSFTFESLISLTDEKEKEAQLKENFSKMILTLNTHLFGEEESDPESGTTKKYGVTIEAAKLKRVIPYGEDAQAHLRALNLKFRTEKDAEAKVITAQATAKADTVVGLAKAEITKANLEAEAAGDMARFVAAEAHPLGAEIILSNQALGNGRATFVVPKSYGDTAEKIATALAAKAKEGGNS